MNFLSYYVIIEENPLAIGTSIIWRFNVFGKMILMFDLRPHFNKCLNIDFEKCVKLYVIVLYIIYFKHYRFSLTPPHSPSICRPNRTFHWFFFFYRRWQIAWYIISMHIRYIFDEQNWWWKISQTHFRIEMIINVCNIIFNN